MMGVFQYARKAERVGKEIDKEIDEYKTEEEKQAQTAEIIKSNACLTQEDICTDDNMTGIILNLHYHRRGGFCC